MGKKDGKKSSGKGGGASAGGGKQQLPKCTCDHPYNCQCGNRPERPSKGHKWDPTTQQWTGKGHKQRGGGSAHVSNQTAVTTAVGKTTVQPWQRLPSQLLAEHCRREKRPPPKFLPGNNSSSGNYRYKVIVRHGKDRDRDQFFNSPGRGVANEEQAKEEVALLALLALTPTLPHERKLPEPYKTTWKNAIGSGDAGGGSVANDGTGPGADTDAANENEGKKPAAAAASKGKRDPDAGKKTASASASAPAGGNGTGLGKGNRNGSSSYKPSPAVAKSSSSVARPASSAAAASSSNLSLPSKSQFTSVAEKRKLQNERRRIRNQKMRKREAARMANRDHTVFLSAAMRRRIETLLRGDYDGGDLLLGDDDDDSGDDDDDEEGDSEGVGDLRAYIIDRLVHEGFSGRQAREAFRQRGAKVTFGKKASDDDDDDDDRTYEECLQWLCVHLNEEDLPEGFDPRGRTLDVVSNKAIAVKSTSERPSETVPGAADGDRTTDLNERKLDLGEHEGLIFEFAETYGLSVEEAALVFARTGEDGVSASSSSGSRPPLRCRARDVFWNAVLEAAGADGGSAGGDGVGDKGVNEEERQHNVETLADELEALGAIFSPEEVSIANTAVNGERGGGDDSMNGTTIVSISLPNDGGDHAVLLEGATLDVYLPGDGLYPSLPPMALIRGRKWDGHRGASVQVELAKFLSTLTRGEPMVYELFGFASSLVLQEEVSSMVVDLRPFLAGDGSSPSAEVTTDGEERGGSLASTPAAQPQRTPSSPSDPQAASREASDDGPTASSSSGTRKRENGTTREKQSTKMNGKQQTKRSPGGGLGIRRPRGERGSFWCVRPRDTPPAVAYPKIGTVLERARRGLPASNSRGEFLEIMKRADKAGRVVLVTGETGCGKTTQIPQFILEEAPAGAKIVVAQPRRLAATGVAARVANERGEDAPGKASVGYVVRGDVATCRNTRLLFCTTGVLLRQLQSEAALECITHVVVDEVHERHLDTDVLLGLLKQLLVTSPHLRVVLMSATMDADRFAAYWGKNTPRMHIPGFTHPVKDFALEDVLRVTGYIPPKKGSKRGKSGRHLYRASSSMASPWADSEFSDNEEDDSGPAAQEDSCLTSDTADKPTSEDAGFASAIDIEDRLKRVDEGTIDYGMIAALVKHLLGTKRDDDDGSVLVFLPGAPEISKAEQNIKRVLKGRSMQVLPLHGGLQPRDQNLVFKKAPRGCTKIILSTNVAETSITIPDCTIVIDSCKEKQSSYDPINRMPLLVERFACKDSLKQRRGRAGRVRPGTCYKLISKASLNQLPEHGEPEIRRCALDQTLLSLIFLGVERGRGNFLRTLLDAPSDESIRSALLSLHNLGAVEYMDDEGKQLVLSPLGVHLAGIPAPPSVGKLLVMGSLLGCRSAALSIAAGMSVGRSPFIRVDIFNKSRCDSDKLDSMQLKVIEEREKVFKSVGNSDHAMLAAVFARWNSIDGGGGAKKRYCDSLGLSYVGMRDMMQLVRQYDSSLSSVGFTSSEDADLNAEYWRIVRSCVVAALAPSQLVRVERPSAKYSETAEGAIEKDSQAKEFKFFVRVTKDAKAESISEDAQVTVTKRYHGISEERVFIHPSSGNFKVGSFSCPWLVYHELVRTTRPYLRDATECSSYALLLFGGKLDVQAVNGLIVVDEWVRLSAPPRIGALINGLRLKVDKLLAEKVSNPRLDIVCSTEMKIIVKLLKSDGLGQ